MMANMEVPNDQAIRKQDVTTSLNEAGSSSRQNANAAETARIKKVVTPD